MSIINSVNYSASLHSLKTQLWIILFVNQSFAIEAIIVSTLFSENNYAWLVTNYVYLIIEWKIRPINTFNTSIVPSIFMKT